MRKTRVWALGKPENMKSSDSKAHPKDGERLLIIRRTHKKSQHQFATEFGVSVGTVANYEKAKTEIPPSFSRGVLGNYGQNPTPPDPEEDPLQLLPPVSSTTKVENNEHPRSIFANMMRLRKRCVATREGVYSPVRRFVEDAIHAAFTVAALVFALEQIRRLLPYGAQDPSLFRDVIFVGASLTISLLFIPVIQSMPWGMKARLNGEV
jgi:hypothetical protein